MPKTSKCEILCDSALRINRTQVNTELKSNRTCDIGLLSDNRHCINCSIHVILSIQETSIIHFVFTGQ